MLVYMSNINVKDHINSFYQSYHVHVMYQIREPKRHPKIWYVLNYGDERLFNSIIKHLPSLGVQRPSEA